MFFLSPSYPPGVYKGTRRFINGDMPYIYIYIYIYIERERERHMYIYIYIHTHTHTRHPPRICFTRIGFGKCLQTVVVSMHVLLSCPVGGTSKT